MARVFTLTGRILKMQAGRYPHLDRCRRCGHVFEAGDLVVKPARGPRSVGKRYCESCAEQVNMI